MSCNLCTLEPNETTVNEDQSEYIPVSPIPDQSTNSTITIKEAEYEMISLLDEMKNVQIDKTLCIMEVCQRTFSTEK